MRYVPNWQNIAKWLKMNAIVGALFLICLILSFLSPYFLTFDNLINITRQVSVMGILALGQTVVITSAGIDLSVGSLVGLTGALVAGFQPYGTPLAVIFTLLAGILLGSINGAAIIWGEVPPFIATLGMLSAARGATLIYTGGQPIYQLNESFRFIGAGNVGTIPTPVLIFGALIVCTYLFLNKTIYGLDIVAIGGNSEAAKLTGIPINNRLMLVYCIMGLFSAVSGIVLTSRLNSADPTAGTGLLLDSIAAVILGGTSLFGGKSSVVGTVIGALLLGVSLNGFNLLHISSFYQHVFEGVIVVLAVLLDTKLR